MKDKLYTIMAVFLALGLGSTAFAASSIQTFVEDTSPAIQVYNGDADETLTITISTNGAGNNLGFVIGSTSNNIDGSGSAVDTVTEFIAAINACTNSDGRTVLTANGDMSLGADSTDDELLDGTYTASPGKWVTIPWDTSAGAKVHDNGYRKNSAPATVTPQYTLDHVYGQSTGTGLMTIRVYIDGVQVYLDNTATYTNAVETIDLDLNIPVEPSQACFVRIDRATTHTAATLSIITKSRDP